MRKLTLKEVLKKYKKTLVGMGISIVTIASALIWGEVPEWLQKLFDLIGAGF